MKKFFLKNKFSLIIFFYALFFSAAIYLLFGPLLNRIKSVSNQIQEKTVDQKTEGERLQNLSQMEKDWQDYQEQKNLAEVIVLPGSEISFIESIDSIAQKSGNTINLKIGDQVDPQEIAKMKSKSKNSQEQKGIMEEISYNHYFPMQISLRGDYPGLVNFIRLLETEHFYVNIISIDSKKQVVEQNSEEETEPKETISSLISAIVYTQP